MNDNYTSKINDGAQHPHKLSEIKYLMIEFVTNYEKVIEVGINPIDVTRKLFYDTYIKYCKVFDCEQKNVESFYQFTNDLQRVMVDYYHDYLSAETVLELYDAFDDLF